MIAANELRIGNWIKDRGGKEWQIDNWESPNKVSAKDPEFNTCGMLLKGHPCTEYVHFLQPISLTEEWLVRFGFIKSDLSDRFIIHSWFYLEKCKDGYKFRQIDGFTRVFQHVHQLQNLYFALTGEELTLREEVKP